MTAFISFSETSYQLSVRLSQSFGLFFSGGTFGGVISSGNRSSVESRAPRWRKDRKPGLARMANLLAPNCPEQVTSRAFSALMTASVGFEIERAITQIDQRFVIVE